MATKILLVNPPIYDFTAYDFWLKPYDLLSIASEYIAVNGGLYEGLEIILAIRFTFLV